MKKVILTVFLLLFVFTSCAAEKQDDSFALQDFLKLIKSSGHTYKIPEGFATVPMLSVPYTLLAIGNVENDHVIAFEYESIELMEADIESISSDGFTLRNASVSWVNPPQFYQKGRLILIYAGKNEKTMRFLDKHFGDVFAGMETEEKLETIRWWDEIWSVRALVDDFGAQLQEVDLTAPKEKASKDIKKKYAAYVTPELLERWIRDPEKAPGRAGSSPWPDRIEGGLNKLSDNEYELEGNIVWITSAEVESGRAAFTQPVVLKIIKDGKGWRISDMIIDSE